MENDKNKDATERINAWRDSMTPEEKAGLERFAAYYDDRTPTQQRISDAFNRPTVEEYRKIVGLNSIDLDPTKDDLVRLSKYKTAASLCHDSRLQELLSAFRRQEHSVRLARFREFQSFDSLEEIFKEWDCKRGRIVEVKFIKPSTLAEWQPTIYRCATMVKVLKTLNYFMEENLQRCNFVYQCKTLFKKTTHAFEYNAANFAFIIRTGLGSGGQEVRNVSVDFYEQTQQQLHYLLDEMHKELPQSHYERVLMLYVLIKDKKRAILQLLITVA